MRSLLTLALCVTPLLIGCFQEDALNTPSPVATDAPTVDNAEQAAEAEEPQTETVKAEVGVGEKGDYGRGFIATPLSALWAAKEQIAYDIQVRSTLNLYKATHGKPPQTHEEFMTEIIEKNQIQLPELPEGHSYIYNTELDELQVRRPVE